MFVQNVYFAKSCRLNSPFTLGILSETNQYYQALIIYLNEAIPLHFIHE